MFTENHDLVIHLPLPNVDIEETKLYEIKEQFRNSGKEIKLQAEDEFPIAFSWAEIVIGSASFFSGIVVSHYAEMLLDAFDSLVKKKIKELNLTIRGDKCSTYRDIPLEDRKKSIEELEGALNEIKIFSERNDAMIYWPAKSEKKDNGELWIYTSSSNGGGLRKYKPNEPGYALWIWIIQQVEGSQMITDQEVDEFTQQYNVEQDSVERRR